MIKIPISIGELLDKITILQIKAEKTDNQFVYKELKDLIKIAKFNNVYNEEYINQLKEINSTLWVVEDELRELESQQRFDDHFIQLARSVYKTNDKRASIKKEINKKYNSTYQEVKLYSNK
jgi:hypothetical protein